MLKKKNQKELSIEYWLSDIKILNFKLSEEDEGEEDAKNVNLKMNLSLNGDYNKEKKKVSITVLVIIHKDNEEETIIAELKVRYIYNIQNSDTLNENNEILLPKNLLDTFNKVSISTTRGILFTKFQATKIDDFIIPLINFDSFEKGE